MDLFHTPTGASAASDGPTRRRFRAFTLLELIVVIIILGILALIAVPSYNAVTERSRDAADEATLASVARNAAALAAFDQEPVGEAHWETAFGELAAAGLGVTATAAGENVWTKDTDGTIAANEWKYFPGTGNESYAIAVTDRLAADSRAIFARAGAAAGAAVGLADFDSDADVDVDDAVAAFAAGGSAASGSTTTTTTTTTTAPADPVTLSASLTDSNSAWMNSTQFSPGPGVFIGDNDGTSYDYQTYMLFPGLTIPAGATITEAHVTFGMGFAYGVIPETLLSAELTASPSVPTDQASFASRSYTASVPWTPAVWDNTGNPIDSANLSAQIQQVVDLPGWASGSGLAILWADSTGYDVKDLMSAGQASTIYEPVLHITYQP